MKTNEQIQADAVVSVLEERKRQTAKWGEQNHDPITWSAILGEECGEFAEAALHTKFGGPKAAGLRMEAVQCAAVALQIVEFLDKQEEIKATALQSGMKIFKMNDCDWWMAPTLDEAKAAVLAEYGPKYADELIVDPVELTEADLDRLKYTQENGSKITFREELANRIKAGAKTEMFASTEF